MSTHPVQRRAITALLVLISLIPVAAATAAPVRVVATTTILGDVARQLGGPDVTVQTLMPVGADPHQFSPSARQAADLRRADLVIANGAGLESGLAKVLDRARDDGAPILEVAPVAAPRRAPGGGTDPHFWTDPRRMEMGARSIAAAIARRVPASRAGAVARRAKTYRARILAVDARIRRQVAALPRARRVLVTNHHVLGYFAHRYTFRVVGAVIPSTSTLATASAADLAELTRAIRRHHVPAIFVDASSPRTLADALAREAGVNVRVVTLWSESLGPRGSGAETYLGMMRTNGARIVAALRR